MSQIAIVGAGSVGAQVAYTLMLSHVCTKILMVDVNEERCKGVVLDLSDASDLTDTLVDTASFAEASNADLIIITAGAKQAPNEKRSDLLLRNVKIMQSVWKGFGNSVGDDTIVMLVANPVDVMAGVFQRISGLPHSRVVGSGTYLDSRRLRQELASAANVATSAVHAYIVGEHGDAQVPLLSSASISGIPLKLFDGLQEAHQKDASSIARDKAYEIILRTGATFYGIAACAQQLAEAILVDRKQVFPISVYSPEFRSYVSLPAVLGRSGVQKILPLSLSFSERIALQKVASTIRERVNVAIPMNFTAA